MQYKKHKKDFYSKASYYAYLKNPEATTQNARYFSKYFDVYECDYKRHTPRNVNRTTEATNGRAKEVINNVFKRKNHNWKRFCKQYAHRADRHLAKKWLKTGDFEGSTVDVKYKSIAWLLD